jgi:predicted RND superfamily exporter protein
VAASGCVDFDGSGRQQQMNTSAIAGRNNAKQSTTTTMMMMRTNNNTTQQQQPNNMAHRQVIQQQQQPQQHIQQVHYLSAPAGSSSQSNIPLVQNLHTIQVKMILVLIIILLTLNRYRAPTLVKVLLQLKLFCLPVQYHLQPIRMQQALFE